MATFPATLSDLQTYISGLINDPTNTRYTLTMINNQLDLAQHRWNMEAKICRWTTHVNPVANQAVYQISTYLNIAPIMILRSLWKGVSLIIRSKEVMDQYSAIDWMTTTGTPAELVVDLNSNDGPSNSPGLTGASLILHPTPAANDVTFYNNNLVYAGNPGYTGVNPWQIESLVSHTPMVNATDQPFTIFDSVSSITYKNNLILPYLAGLGLDVAAALLEPDPTPETASKAKIYRAQANAYLSLVMQMYQGLEEATPSRMIGGRTWIPTRTVSSPFSR